MRTPPRILIVDDTPANVEILEMRLAAHGYEMLTARDGEEALAIIGDKQPDLILLDIMMPGMDGITAFKKLKETVPDIPVIFMTAKAQSHELASYMELGITGVISKPFDPLKLPESVKDILNEKNEGTN